MSVKNVGCIFKTIAVAMLALSSCQSVHGECRRHTVRGPCDFSASCVRDVRGLAPDARCRAAAAAADMRVDVRLAPHDADPGLERADPALLAALTELRVSGAWPDVNLSFLQHTWRLRLLTLVRTDLHALPAIPFSSLGHLETLDLSNNSLQHLGDAFQSEASPGSLRLLSIAHNELESLPADAFAGLRALVELDLSHNRIADLGEKPFRNLTSLETLRLNDNRIINLNGALDHLQNLKHLYLSGNGLQKVDFASLRVIYHLETFDASGNQLELLRAGLFLRHWQHFGNFCRILLADNHITHVPAPAPKEIWTRFTRHAEDSSEASGEETAMTNKTKFGKDEVLDVKTVLDLSNNSITNVDFNAFQSLVGLVNLDLSSNRLIDFDVEPADLQYVRYLNLSYNYIIALEFDFSSVVNLQRLDLSHNHLDMPDELFGPYLKLQYLNLAYNSFQDTELLQKTSFSPEGGVLDMRATGLSAYRAHHDTNTRKLILSNNNISVASDVYLRDQYDLKELDLSQNLVVTLDDSSLNLPVYLQLLDFSDNYLETMSTGAFEKLKRLHTLRLGGNRLTKVEAGAFSGLSSLVSLDLSRNHFGFLDPAALQDLKSLQVLSLRSNQIAELDDKAWIGHNFVIKVYLDGSTISCAWLSDALNNFNNGMSRMKPVAEGPGGPGWSAVEGIPCREGENLKNPEPHADPRLLFVTRRILDALKEQNLYLRKLSHSENETQKH